MANAKPGLVPVSSCQQDRYRGSIAKRDGMILCDRVSVGSVVLGERGHMNWDVSLNSV